jgi:cholest-4-en-3-one 26-monooxygenase
MSTEANFQTLSTIDLSQNDLFRHGFPHEIFSVLRNEAPVWRHPLTPGVEAIGCGEFWVVSSHAELLAVSHDHERFRSFEGPRLGGWEPRMRGQMLITMDQPDHTRLRRLVSSGFTPRRVAMLEDQAREWSVKIIESALEKGESNFVHEVAYQLPMHMIADIVGIPLADREHVFSLVNRTLYSLDSESDAFLSEEERGALQGQVFMYGRELAAEKRRNPADDVWTQLTTTEVTLPDGTVTQLTELELDLFFTVLTVAGSETTRNSIASGLIALVENPDQLERLRNDPALMDTAVDEIIRWASPVTYFQRTAVQDTELNGAEIKAGDPVTLWYPSANRDATVFSDPFRFDVTRKPNPHVSFGAPGIHHCLGANLARREIKVMFEELLARVGEIEILGDPLYSVSGIQSPVVLSMKELPVRLSSH